MCGICGVIRADGRAVRQADLDRMTDLLEHRGPDDRGTYLGAGTGPDGVEASVGLGMRRLSIIDLSGGHQPMFEGRPGSADCRALVYNGEIYNFQEVRPQLEAKGARFHTRSDTEVVLQAYVQRGRDCLGDLRGMFALALWDGRSQRLWLARDRFGKKPLYYAMGPGGTWLAFASEIKALLSMPEILASTDPEALYHYLTFQYVPDPLTLFKGIGALPPGHDLLWSPGRDLEPGEPRRYWDHLWEPVEQDPDEAAARVRAELEESVRLRMIADVPVGAFLSGGLDSSAIVGLMSAQTGPGMLNTFSVAPLGGSPDSDERTHARRVAEHFGTVHREVEVSPEEYAASLPHLMWHQDQPVADPSAVLLYFVARLAREHVTVVLSGEGADELFGGYLIYGEPFGTAPYRSLPRPLQRPLLRLARRLPEGTRGANYVLRAGTPLRDRYYGNASVFWGTAKAELWRGPSGFDSRSITAPWWDASSGQDLTTQMQTVDVHTWLPGDILMKADKMTMANSLELRVPFLDHRLAAVAATLPTGARIAHGTTKWLLRRAVSDLLPAENLGRSKLGFPVPMATWLRGPLKGWAREQLAGACLDEFLDRGAIERQWDDHQSGRADRARRLWVLLCYAAWHGVFVEGRTPEPATALAGAAGVRS
jgi:asparagine synthase (glutamine-hydrolysing)